MHYRAHNYEQLNRILSAFPSHLLNFQFNVGPTPWSGALKKPPVVKQLLNKNRLFVRFGSMQSIPPHLISLRSILILSTNLLLCPYSGLSPFGFPTNILYYVRIAILPIRAKCPAHLILLGFISLFILFEDCKF
jgi:hypothetical protein